MNDNFKRDFKPFASGFFEEKPRRETEQTNNQNPNN